VTRIDLTAEDLEVLEICVFRIDIELNTRHGQVDCGGVSDMLDMDDDDDD